MIWRNHCRLPCRFPYREAVGFAKSGYAQHYVVHNIFAGNNTGSWSLLAVGMLECLVMDEAVVGSRAYTAGDDAKDLSDTEMRRQV